MGRFLERALAAYFQLFALTFFIVWLGFPIIFLVDVALEFIGVRLELTSRFLWIFGSLFNLLQAPFNYTTFFVLSVIVVIPVILNYLVRSGLDRIKRRSNKRGS